MSFSELLPFFLTAAAVAFIYIKRSKAREQRYEASEITPVVTRNIFFDEPPADFKARITHMLAEKEIHIHSTERNRTVFDSKKISAFHWGFLYTVDITEQADGTLAVLGIFGKGPNPPRRKTQESYLNDFITFIT